MLEVKVAEFLRVSASLWLNVRQRGHVAFILRGVPGEGLLVEQRPAQPVRCLEALRHLLLARVVVDAAGGREANVAKVLTSVQRS